MVTRTHARRERRVVKKEKEPDGTNHQVVLRTLVDTRRSNVTVLDSRLATDHQVAAGAYPFLENIEDAVFIQMWNLTPTHRSNFDKSSPLSIELGKSKISSPGYAECEFIRLSYCVCSTYD
jgi:hypothetical protein